ncbi:multicopper oxidase family protein [Pseudarthrobacter oxydans]|uniref:multicopper oxidase family protein n=1 Tax=Pseudarthrobacter oxydans TaxID=1671 RepID=UPI003427244C
MGVSQLLGLDIVLSVLAAGAWCALAWLMVEPGRRSSGVMGKRSRSARLLAPLLLGAALTLTAAKVAAVATLTAAGWLFASERAAVGLPLLVLPAAVAGVAGVAHLRPRIPDAALPAPRVPAAVFVGWAAIGASFSMLAPFILGFDPYPAGAALFVALAVCCALVFWILAGNTAGTSARRTTAASAVGALILAAVAGSAGIGWLGSRSAEGAAIAAVGHHGTPVTAESGEEGGIRPITELIEDPAPGAMVRRFELTARQERVTSPGGKTVDAWTFGSLPGPALEAELGDLLEVVLINRDVSAGVTLHWHGYDVPNAMDGVAGATQDAVRPGHSMTYRFLAGQSGTYWYHTHQASSEGVRKGLYGTLVVRDPREPRAPADLVVAGHSIASLTLLGGSDMPQSHNVYPGTAVRLRLVNTDSLPQRYQLLGSHYAVAAVDGTELPTPIEVPAGQASEPVLRLGAGGRMDLTFAMPAHPVTLRTEGSDSAAVVLDPTGSGVEPPATADFRGGMELDISAGAGPGDAGPAGTPAWSRTEVMVLDRQLRFVDGAPRYAYTVNGAAYPNIKPLVVIEGEAVKVTVANRTSEPHPMHPHGHHVLVLSRNGQAPAASPLWLDTFDVLPGDVWEVLLRADNPGIWMGHCHNLDHAAQGMMMHLQYRGYSSPFVHGGSSGNRPE